MKIRNIGSNMTELETEKATVLFSYSTPVAACIHDGSGFFRTAKRWSVTTSKHISKWLDGRNATEKPQEFFDALTA